jgi:hypothetical protein
MTTHASYVADKQGDQEGICLGRVGDSTAQPPHATAVRRVVLLAVVRPVVEHGAVHHGCPPAATPGAGAEQGAAQDIAAPVCCCG